jgi:hypothetical protein
MLAYGSRLFFSKLRNKEKACLKTKMGKKTPG